MLISQIRVLCATTVRARGKMGICQINDALQQLNPRNFYVGADNLRKEWCDLFKMEETRKSFDQYVRIVSSNQGFTKDVKDQVRSYNAKNTGRPILLFEPSVSTIGRQLMGNALLMKEAEKPEGKARTELNGSIEFPSSDSPPIVPAKRKMNQTDILDWINPKRHFPNGKE